LVVKVTLEFNEEGKITKSTEEVVAEKREATQRVILAWAKGCAVNSQPCDTGRLIYINFDFEQFSHFR